MGSERARQATLTDCLIEAIDEVAPGRGKTVYWRAFARYEQAVRNRPQVRQPRQLTLDLPLMDTK